MIEVLTAEMQQEYLESISVEKWDRMLVQSRST